MKKRGIFLCLAALLCLGILTGARGEAPAAVRDTADVLSQGTVGDLIELDRRLAEAGGLHLALVTRHFLGGADAGQYAKELLAGREDGEHCLLLLLVIGEEKYASAAGAAFQAAVDGETVKTLLSTRLRDAFLARDYDRAVASFFTAAAVSAASHGGYGLKTAGLFALKDPAPGQAAQASPSGGTSPASWVDSLLTGMGVLQRDRNGLSGSREEDGEGRSRAGSVVLLALILFFVFRRSRRGGQKGRGLLGWLLGGYLVSRLFRRRR